MKINNEVSYKDKCVFVRSKIKEVINDIRKVVIPSYKSYIQDTIDGRVTIGVHLALPSENDPILSIYKLEYICDILKKWYNTISKNVDGELMGNIFTEMQLFIQREEECITTTVNSLYIFFNTFYVTQMKMNSKYADIFFNTFVDTQMNSKYTTYKFLSLCKHYCECKNDCACKHEIYCENECKLLYYIWELSNCHTLDVVNIIYKHAIKPIIPIKP